MSTMTRDSHMVHLGTERAVFNLPAVCVFVEGDHVFIHRAELGERTCEAAAREMREELKVAVAGRVIIGRDYARRRHWRRTH